MATESALAHEQTAASGAARLAVARPRLPLAEDILPYLQQIDESRWYSNFGPLLTAFEGRLADRFPRPTRVVTVANATQALSLALTAMDLPPGGFVALPSWTFVATAHAVVQAGLRPWFMDVDPETWTLDLAAVRPRVERGEVVAVLPVCPFGAVQSLAAWRDFHDATGAPVLVDAAAAFDALDDARLPAVVSLHATKALGVGEGGFLATEDEALATRVRQLSSFGFHGTRDSLIPATNAKLSEYAAAVGLAALDRWPGDRLRLLRASQLLKMGFIDRPDVRFQEGWGAEWATSVCTVELPDGAAPAVTAALAEDGIDTRAWWGEGCHTSPAFADCRRDPLPVTERLARSTVGLPFAIDLTTPEVDRIAAPIRRALAAG